MAENRQQEEQKPLSGTAPKGHKRKRGMIIAGIAICALVLGVIFLPKPIARYVIADQLNALGIAHKGVDTLTINLWGQEVTVGPLEFTKSNAAPGQIGKFLVRLRLVNLLSKQAVVENVIIDGVDLKVHRSQQGAITVNGIDLQAFAGKRASETPPKSVEDPWQAALEKLQLRNSVVVLDQEGAGSLTVKIGLLSLNGFRTWEPAKPGNFELDATVNGIGFNWRGEARPFADKITLSIDAAVSDLEIAKIETYIGPLGLDRRSGTLSSQFNHQVALLEDGRIDWVAKGKIAVGGVDIDKAGQGAVRFDKAEADVAATIAVLAHNKVTVAADLDVDIHAMKAATPDGIVADVNKLTVQLKDLSMEIQPDGTVVATAVPRITMSDGGLNGPAAIKLGELVLDLPRVDVNASSESTSLKTAGTASLKNISATLPAADQRPETDIFVRSLDVPLRELTLALTENSPTWKAAFSSTVDSLSVKFAKGSAADLTLTRLSAVNTRLDQSLSIAMDSLLFAGLNVKLTDKSLPPAGEKQPAAAGGQSIEFAVGRLAFADRADIFFKDASVTPEVNAKLAVDRFEIKNLDTGNAEQKSDIAFKAKINDFTDLNLSGWATLLGDKPDFDLKLTLSGLELPRFSPYVAKAVGMHLESGQLNLNAVGTAKKAAIEAKLDVTLRNLELGELSPEETKKLSEAVVMPIQTAIGLLQDSDKTISLKIPMGGTVFKPNVDISDAVQKAVGGALVSLFPPTAIASMLMSASKGGVTFAPIPFKLGTATLDKSGKTMAESLARLLVKRPKLSLRVCGRATLSDLEQYTSLILKQQMLMKPGGGFAQGPSKGRKKGSAASYPLRGGDLGIREEPDVQTCP